MVKKAVVSCVVLARRRRCSSRAAAAAPRGRAAAGGAAKQPIKIGAILSLTGSYAGLGAPEKQALDLEVKRINDAGGVNGRPIEVVIVDDATDAPKAEAAATKLIDQDKVVAILGATGTSGTMAMRSEVDRAGVPSSRWPAAR